MQAGKLPNDLLARLLTRVATRDPRVIVGPGVGRDAAVIDTGGQKLLVAKSDPITFAADEIGWYAVHVNANDIACMGATPQWFLATVLLPEGCAAELPGQILDQVAEACDSLGVTLIGGHTEVTHGLPRPIVSGAMLGEVDRDRLVRPETSQPGDSVLLTKGVAIEGTAVLAREARDRLSSLGVEVDVLDRASRLLRSPGISVVPEAHAACDAVTVRAMHDPTEGGIATALSELALATGCGVRIDAEIPILPETAAVCRAASLDPLGLLASGALLLVVPEDECANAISSIEGGGVAVTRIGTLVRTQAGVIMWANDAARPFPSFVRDEVARFLSEQPD
jgi:hydrogenase maturation factor